jgi:hypothetical protein
LLKKNLVKSKFAFETRLNNKLIYTYEIDLDNNWTNNILQEISLEDDTILWYILTFCYVFGSVSCSFLFGVACDDK